MVLGFVINKMKGNQKKTPQLSSSRGGNSNQAEKFDNRRDPDFPIMFAAGVGFLVVYFLLNYLDRGMKILTKPERIANNFVWDAQMHNQTVMFVHIAPKSRYSHSRKQYGKKKITFEGWVENMVGKLLPFDEHKLWGPYRERINFDFGQHQTSEYIGIKFTPNFTVPDDDFFERHNNTLPFNATSKDIFYK